MKKFISFLLLLCTCFLFSDAQTAADAEAIKNIQWTTKTIADGIILKNCEKESFFSSLQSIAILEIDTAVAKVDFKVDFEKSEFHPVSVFGRKNKAIAAINGTYFNVNTGISWHFIKIDGKKVAATVENEFSTRASGVFTVTDGVVDISTWNKEKEAALAGDAEYALVCGPLMLDDDADFDMWDDDFTSVRHPRSCVANTGNGKVLIIAVDGRQSNRANGMSLYELRFFVRQLGCVDAMNLDGGGSTALYVAGQPNYGIVNKPIDENVPGKERNVGNILYITPRDGSKPYSVAARAPGGVHGMRMWIKADGEVSKDAENKLKAPYVFDYTGYNNFEYAKQNENAEIHWSEDRVNSYPSLLFDSVSVLKSDRKAKFSTFYSVNTLNKEGTLLGFDESGSHHPKFRYFLMANADNVYVHDGSNTTGGTNYTFIPYQDNFDNSFNLYSSSYGKKYDTFVLNGEEQLETQSNFCTRENINAFLQIGARNSYPTTTDPTKDEYFYRGETAEIIAYPDTLTASEHVRVESYLAVKYGITIAKAEYRYTASYGTRWWDGRNAGYKPYSNYITFIGRDDNSGLYQLRGKSIGNHLLPKDGCILSLSHGESKIENDQYFICAGSSLEDLALTTGLVSGDTIYQVMQRNWKFNISDSQSEAFNVEIDIPAVHKTAFNEDNAGLLVKSADVFSYYKGTLDAGRNKISVNNLTVKKADVMYLVLDKSGNTSVVEGEQGLKIKFWYDAANKTIYVADYLGCTYDVCIYSASGNLVCSRLNQTGETQISTHNFIQGVYFVNIQDSRKSTLKKEKIIIAY